MKTLFNVSARFKNERGVTLVYVALLLVVILGIAAFAIDVGYHRVVRNQLQNAADAAALAGCNRLYEREVVVFPAPPPDWAAATTEATSAIGINTADNKVLSDGTIATGWWNITQPSLGLRDISFIPTSDDGPAISVTITKTKSDGENDGPVVNFFGGILGVSTTDISATGTAVAASPGWVRAGAVVPVAIARALADRWLEFNSSDNLVIIGSPYHYPDNLAGEWTTFLGGESDTTAVRALIEDGNPVALGTEQNIFIRSGVADTLYYSPSKNQVSINSEYSGKDVVFPIVDGLMLENTHAWRPISGFAVFHIVCAGKACAGMPGVVGTNPSIIMGYFKEEPVYGNGPIGPHYGALDRCRLCQ
jgi:Flp pilus assembly protein TadG